MTESHDDIPSESRREGILRAATHLAGLQSLRGIIGSLAPSLSRKQIDDRLPEETRATGESIASLTAADQQEATETAQGLLSDKGPMVDGGDEND